MYTGVIWIPDNGIRLGEINMPDISTVYWTFYESLMYGYQAKILKTFKSGLFYYQTGFSLVLIICSLIKNFKEHNIRHEQVIHEP